MKILSLTMLLIILMIVCVCISANQDTFSAELATNQMDIEGSQSYTVYHNISESLYTASAICSIAIVIYTIYFIKRGNKK